MGNHRNRIIFSLFALAALSACQKVSPEVYSLRKPPYVKPPEPPLPELEPAKNSRITIGSTDGIITSAANTYRLRARLSADDAPTGSTSTSYKLHGTVRFGQQ